MVTLIDGDSIIHIIAYNHREADPDPGTIYQVQISVDSFLQMILNMSKADSFLGAIGNPKRKCFRNKWYRYQTYKGTRPPDPEHMIKWRDYITHYMSNKYGFVSSDHLEADDIISGVAEILRIEGKEYVIASPDKDMKQIRGIHMNYKKEIPEFCEISEETAIYNLWLQILSGDSNDNVAGIPKIGPVKAAALLKSVQFVCEYGMVTRQAYYNYFGPTYGPVVFEETKNAIELMSTQHKLYPLFGKENKAFRKAIRPFGVSKGIFE